MVTRSDDIDDIDGVGLLAEPTRRLLYDLVAAADRPVTREEAAEAAGVPLHTAKFHLDRLAEAGLLAVEFHKVAGRDGRPGRTGPGSGRPSKHYRRAGREVSIALPPRQYDLLSRLLADAIVTASESGVSAEEAARRQAFAEGQALGAAHEDAAGSEVERLQAVLVEGGYEPRETAEGVVLRNCPFHAAVQRQTAFVCGVNLEYVGGIVDGLRLTQRRACLDPEPGQCCVKVVPTQP